MTQTTAQIDPAALAGRSRDEFLVFGRPMLGDGEIAEVTGSIQAGWIGTGPKVHAFERMLEEYIGVEHVRCVSSCTAALILGMEVLGVGPGDEVLVPSMTFVASANAIEHTGATPVFVDSDPRTGLIDLDQAEAAITDRTAAIMPVHLSGRPVDMERLAQLRDRYGIKIVEDAAHALGTQWQGRQIGSFGNLAAYSFYVTKNITTIEGGAIATDDPAVAAKVEQLSLHGLSLGAWQRFSDKGFRHYEVEKPGYKYNMTDVQAAFGIQQLPQLDRWIEIRAEQWDRYDELLSDLPLRLPAEPEPDTVHARHLYQVQVEPEAAMQRDELLDYLTSQKIGSGVHYRGVHLHPYYRDRYGIAAEDLPVAAHISDTTLSLPLSPAVSEADQLDVVGALTRALSGPRRNGRFARPQAAAAR
jgi:dTDP-4-amino-4,6-dideoxygalactose transaminase